MLLKTGSRYKSLSMEQVFPPNIIICIYVYNNINIVFSALEMPTQTITRRGYMCTCRLNHLEITNKQRPSFPLTVYGYIKVFPRCAVFPS